MSNVLLVDDDADTVDMTKRFLKVHGIHVVGVGYDGKHAVELCEKLHPDIMCLDLSMPIYDGFYTIEKMKTLGNRIKILVITGNKDPESEAKLNTSNVTMVLHKPLNLDALVKYIKGMDCKPLAA